MPTFTKLPKGTRVQLIIDGNVQSHVAQLQKETIVEYTGEWGQYSLYENSHGVTYAVKNEEEE